MICPHCNTSFFEEWTQTNALVWDNEDGQGLEHTPCPECGKLIVRLVEGKVDIREERFIEEPSDLRKVLIYPTSCDAELADEIPDSYKMEYIESRKVLKVSPKSSAAIGRRLLQRLLEEEMKIQGNNLSKQIDKFLGLENIPSHVSKSIDAVRNIGNFAAHPSKETSTGTIVEVEPGEAEWIQEVVLSLFDFIFIQPLRIEKRRNELNKKLRRLGKPEMKG